MTRGEAIKKLQKQKAEYLEELKKKVGDSAYEMWVDYSGVAEAFDMATEALTDVVNEDGTLTVRVSDGSKVKRILVLGDDRCGGLYYADGDDDDDNWIPVSEKMPSQAGMYLVTIVRNGSIWTDKLWYTANAKGWWGDDERGYDSINWNDWVTAWMPLPEPHREAFK